jgi:hypothetical protein
LRLQIAWVLAAIFLAIPPAQAQQWGVYHNNRFGYESSIPPGFSGYGESDNGDGEIYDHPGTSQTLTFWGANLAEASFEAEVAASIGYAERDGFTITASVVTSRWAEFSGTNGERQFTRRMILLCDGASTASMTLQFTLPDAGRASEIMPRLAEDFIPAAC